MKREISVPKASPWKIYNSRTGDIAVALSRLGFYGDLAEEQINSVLVKLHETEEALEASQRGNADIASQRDALLREISDADRQIRNLKAEIAELSRRNQNQYNTIRMFQGLTGLSEPERRSGERRGNDAWLIDGKTLDAIKALGAISPRTNMQTEVLKDLIASVRIDGSSTFRTPGNDRRKK